MTVCRRSSAATSVRVNERVSAEPAEVYSDPGGKLVFAAEQSGSGGSGTSPRRPECPAEHSRSSTVLQQPAPGLEDGVRAAPLALFSPQIKAGQHLLTIASTSSAAIFVEEYRESPN
ncbi:hypothetical protein FQA47_019495 [Oryzias melastigma]|uniref:Uncharacterized protein n=1 Tax=Oryzias melastigma TaxID=30732 RepID=A0A834FAI6_ORYME|nr:hypothetical protein FQA47_019495 [Oryzias melastigma]